MVKHIIWNYRGKRESILQWRGDYKGGKSLCNCGVIKVCNCGVLVIRLWGLFVFSFYKILAFENEIKRVI